MQEITFCRNALTELLLENVLSTDLYIIIHHWLLLIYLDFYCFVLENISYLSGENKSFFEISAYRLLFFHLWASIWTWCFSLNFPSAEIPFAVLVWKIHSDRKPAEFFSLKIHLRKGPLSVPPGCVLLKMRTWIWCWTPGSPLTHRHLLNMVLFLSSGATVTEADF